MNFFQNKTFFKVNDFYIFLPNQLKIVPLQLKLPIKFEDILFVDKQKEKILKNTINFSKNIFSHNTLLWGARGMGKSSIIKSVVKKINKNNEKVKLIEIFSGCYKFLPELIYSLSSINHNFILFIDDISFENNESDFRLFKTLIDGSLISNTENVRFYVTSNLRHLSEKRILSDEMDELTKKEINSNIFALSDRFGCWVGFYENNKNNYIETIKLYAQKKSIKINEELIDRAIKWSVEKGNFSGRTAYQFINSIL
tara:strand:+ start:93 stop:857 length:765 start_codon:yes stop_codon:yes gene_type:complete